MSLPRMKFNYIKQQYANVKQTELWQKAQKHKTILAWSPTAISILVLSVIFLARGCSDEVRYDFDDKDDALEMYHNYLRKVREIRKTNTKEFGALLYEWQEVSDTIYKFLDRDSVFPKYHNEAGDYWRTHNAVKDEMLRLTETWKYDYADVLLIKENSCRLREDTILTNAVKAAEPFFNALDKEKISECDKSSILFRYRYFLQQTKKNGIHNRAEMLAFIRSEDFLFRTFLAHLYEMDNEPLTDITHDTEEICRNIFMNTREGGILPQDAVVYMSMRTGRRLLQNSVACVKGLNSPQVKDKAKANAYLWMIVQPFLSIDQLSLSTMTETERSQFLYIAMQLPKSRRFAENFGVDLKALSYLLPQQILKLYVSSL